MDTAWKYKDLRNVQEAGEANRTIPKTLISLAFFLEEQEDYMASLEIIEGVFQRSKGLGPISSTNSHGILKHWSQYMGGTKSE
ncbi:hypothetical protein [Methanospirillum hungatei]|uniref:hypothetical protein n=1 Tax=Methanospirillum hungatei TaxID=2203 RepID=UPI0026F105A0|nr:hypothetical protein [Methanospirillum hungatei]MCA1916612.1 hypothetical protein [Methanospirillum hungatei]